LGKRLKQVDRQNYGFIHYNLKGFREEHTLRVFQKRILMIIFGLKWDEVTGGLRKLHNEELHNLYSSPVIIRMINSRRMMWEGNVTRMGEKRDAYMILR
jgi:hypothetical protein